MDYSQISEFYKERYASPALWITHRFGWSANQTNIAVIFVNRPTGSIVPKGNREHNLELQRGTIKHVICLFKYLFTIVR